MFFLINVKKKKRRLFYGYHEILRNLYDKTRLEFKRSPSIRHIGRNQVHFPVSFFCQAKITGTFLYPFRDLDPRTRPHAKIQPN